MPLILRKIINENTEVGAWKITENLRQLISRLYLNEEEFETLYSFKSIDRQKQWLSYRALIRTLVKHNDIYKIYYTISGKPYLIQPPRNISVSHSNQISAVIVSKDINSRIGIDIEKISHKANNVKHKFLNHTELIKTSGYSNDEIFTLFWSVKECIYKLFDLQFFTLKDNIHIQDFETTGEGYKVYVKIYVFDTYLEGIVYCLKLNDYIISYAVL